MLKAKDFIALERHQAITEHSAFAQVRRILSSNPNGAEFFNTETEVYERTAARYSVNLEELSEYSDAFLLISAHKGSLSVEDWLASAESPESEFSSRLGSEYKRSSDSPEEQALLLHDDGMWYPSKSYKNKDLNSSELIDIVKFRNALHKIQKCRHGQTPLNYVQILFKKEGIENGWAILTDKVNSNDAELIKFGHKGNVQLRGFLKAHELIQQYGGIEAAAKKLNTLRILRWITPEITNLENAFKIMDHFYEQPKCLKGKISCKYFLMGHCRPKCTQK